MMKCFVFFFCVYITVILARVPIDETTNYIDDTTDMKYPTHEQEMREIDQPGILFRREYDEDMDDLPQFA